jgi:hypothetical protein
VKKYLLISAAFLIFLMAAPAAHATVMSPGGGAEAIGGLAALPSGSIISNGGNVSIATISGLDAQGHARYTETIYFAVYKEAATGYLDFVYQVANSKKSHDSINRVTNVDFSSASSYLDATYLTKNAPAGFLGGKIAPSTADLSSDSSVVGFNFPSGKGTAIAPGTTTDVFVIRTHSKTFRAGSTSTIDGAVATVGTFAPGPEPSTIVLFAGCFLGLAGWAGWRRWKAGSASV